MAVATCFLDHSFIQEFGTSLEGHVKLAAICKFSWIMPLDDPIYMEKGLYGNVKQIIL